MGILLKWKQPSKESSFDKVRIYRSDAEDGSYSLIQTQPIQDSSFYDMHGADYHWYKLDFYDTINDVSSEMSDPIKGGVFEGYCTVNEVRQLTNLKPSQITDTELSNIIIYAGTQLNADMNIEHEEEEVKYIDYTKENDIDGTNKTFYTRHYPIGDRNNDFEVTPSDIKVETVDSDGNKQEVSVASLNPKTGEFVLDAAPSSDLKLLVTYCNTNRDVSGPHTLVKLASILLTAAWSHSKLNVGKANRFSMGGLTVTRDNEAHKEYFKQYTEIITKVNDQTMTDTAITDEMPATEQYIRALKKPRGY